MKIIINGRAVKESIPKPQLLSDSDVIERIFNHMDNQTTDLGDRVWQEPVEHYHSQERFEAEIALLKRTPVPYCPSAALPDKGSYIARKAAGTPLLVSRGLDGMVRAFINACRHRGMQVARDSGCSRAFICPYHAWTYNHEGKLVGMYGEKTFGEINKEDFGLIDYANTSKLEAQEIIKQGIELMINEVG